MVNANGSRVVDSNPPAKTGTDAGRTRARDIMEIIGLLVVMVIVCGLLLLPTIFYHLPVTMESEQNVRELS